jgi:spore coat protein U-like protein
MKLSNIIKGSGYVFGLVGVANIVAVLGSAAPVMAATATENLSVTAEVTANCTIATAPVAFGNYDPIVAHAATDLDATGTVTTTCTTGSTPIITLGQGANPTGASTDAAPERQLASGTDRLGYQLYQDAPGGTVWGNTAGTGIPPVAVNGTAQATTVFGRIPGGQNVPVGNYSDTVVATVDF